MRRNTISPAKIRTEQAQALADHFTGNVTAKGHILSLVPPV